MDTLNSDTMESTRSNSYEDVSDPIKPIRPVKPICPFKLVKMNPGVTPFRFMDLPRELRNLVYDALWRQSPLIATTYVLKSAQETNSGFYIRRGLDKSFTDECEDFYLKNIDDNSEGDGEYELRTQYKNDTAQEEYIRHRDHPMRLEVQYDDAADKNTEVSGLPDWLLANNIILDEGLDQFRLKAQHWVIGRPLPGSALHKGSSKSSLLSPSGAEKLTFEGRSLQKRDTDPEIHPSRSVHRLNRSADRALAIIVGSFKDLKHLRLRLWIPAKLLTSGYSPLGWKVDLSCLQHGNLRLDKLEVVISGGLVYIKNPFDTAKYNQVLSAFKDEIFRVGEAVVQGQGEGQLTFREDVKVPKPVNYGSGGHGLSQVALPLINRGLHAPFQPRDALSWRFEFTKASVSEKHK
ncbi:hypothetical protein BU26DRAFT_500977 [Trematosphaeria pertusa]|uniref:Uncharacterized protein n=1 Tax=Trematosphaeria pertusa TaxID=390896 RepID=A0A6A6IZB6_9PLEO|nr:uncharacterized protein BU26DRAFT_500977 [Trematosphaeria pertusa]KAF2255407.1 hypothetical protein BU26DRAFT_500977 [Trematosphaeria pertusa]